MANRSVNVCGSWHQMDPKRSAASTAKGSRWGRCAAAAPHAHVPTAISRPPPSASGPPAPPSGWPPTWANPPPRPAASGEAESAGQRCCMCRRRDSAAHVGRRRSPVLSCRCLRQRLLHQTPFSIYECVKKGRGPRAALRSLPRPRTNRKLTPPALAHRPALPNGASRPESACTHRDSLRRAHRWPEDGRCCSGAS